MHTHAKICIIHLKLDKTLNTNIVFKANIQMVHEEDGNFLGFWWECKMAWLLEDRSVVAQGAESRLNIDPEILLINRYNKVMNC